MIGAPRIGASGAVQPFYRRAGGAASGITRTLIGTATATGPAAGPSIPTGVIPATHRLIVVVATYDNFGAVGVVVPTFIGDVRTFSADNASTFGVDNVTLVYSCDLGASGINDTIIWTFPTSPNNFAAVAVYVSGLALRLPDESMSAAGVGTDQDSTASAPTAASNIYVCGGIGTNGKSSDTIGAWQHALAAGADAGTNACQVKEGFMVSAVSIAVQAEVTGATSRSWGAIVQAYQ